MAAKCQVGLNQVFFGFGPAGVTSYTTVARKISRPGNQRSYQNTFQQVFTKKNFTPLGQPFAKLFLIDRGLARNQRTLQSRVVTRTTLAARPDTRSRSRTPTRPGPAPTEGRLARPPPSAARPGDHAYPPAGAEIDGGERCATLPAMESLWAPAVQPTFSKGLPSASLSSPRRALVGAIAHAPLHPPPPPSRLLLPTQSLPAPDEAAGVETPPAASGFRGPRVATAPLHGVVGVRHGRRVHDARRLGPPVALEPLVEELAPRPPSVAGETTALGLVSSSGAAGQRTIPKTKPISFPFRQFESILEEISQS